MRRNLLILLLLLAACGQNAATPQPFPSLALETLNGKPFALSNKKTVINIFATWCAPCKAEHPLLMTLSKTVPVVGIAYMDKPEKVGSFLQEAGNPFQAVALDEKGLFGVQLGLTGVPETLLVENGQIIWRHIGQLTNKEIIYLQQATSK